MAERRMAEPSTANASPAPAEGSLPWIHRLRVWAALAVIALHVSGAAFRAYPGAPTFRWLDANLWNSGTRWAVPVYVILSGYLLLAPEQPPGALRFWRRRASRIAHRQEDHTPDNSPKFQGNTGNRP